MPADYLFTWKLGHWPYSELERLVSTFEAGDTAMEPWRCQAHRKIRIGDKAYMMKLGDAPRGIFGIGTITGEPYRNDEASDGENAWLVTITFDALVDPTKSLLVPESNLAMLDAPKHRWHPQGSGITLEPSAARGIDRFVDRKSSSHKSPNQISDTESLVEKNVRAIVPEVYLLDALKILAHSIRTANQFAPGKWGVRVSHKNIMLKVGFVEALQIHNDFFHHLVKDDLVPKKARENRHYNFGTAPYKNAPGCDTFETELSIAARAYALLLPAHEAAIEIAAQGPIHTTTKNDHSPDLVNFIVDTLEISLPQPTYIETSEEILLYPDEFAEHVTFYEGAAIRVSVNRYERDRAARNKCVQHYGSNCGACGISFGDHYGSGMNGFIHVHHLAPLGSLRKEAKIDPIRDLRPVCPNCHAVIHSSNPPLTLDQVRLLIKKHGKLGSA
jgi:5-methylcytosine-specific restriction protein A